MSIFIDPANPTRQVAGLFQTNPLPGELMDPWPNPIHTLSVFLLKVAEYLKLDN